MHLAEMVLTRANTAEEIDNGKISRRDLQPPKAQDDFDNYLLEVIASQEIDRLKLTTPDPMKKVSPPGHYESGPLNSTEI